MIDLINGIVLFICGLISGAAIHSMWRHAQERKELEDWWRIIRDSEGD